jgi:hypothetical protein
MKRFQNIRDAERRRQGELMRQFSRRGLKQPTRENSSMHIPTSPILIADGCFSLWIYSFDKRFGPRGLRHVGSDAQTQRYRNIITRNAVDV